PWGVLAQPGGELEDVARGCPVARSLSADLKQTYSFRYED
ncbi:MAG: OsmC family peroxiredoxin, partial [Gemmatimonadaceae bacterium]|nr:OsmC family peroxiredoxin [Gemmatimonadaceae bacterium]